MAITSYSQVRDGNMTEVTVTSDLGGTVYYHWYVDGCYVASTTSPVKSFYLEVDEEARVEVLDTNDSAYDPIANAPAGWPSRRSLWWIRSTASDVDHYRVEQKKGVGSWATIGLVQHDDREWTYHLLTPRLDDLETYQWQVIPVDKAGNDGSALDFGSEKIVRTPDSPDFEISFNSGPTTVTFSEAS